MKLQAERAGLTLTVEYPSDLPEVSADALRIEQVLVNLIHNAVKFTPPGGDVVVLAEAGEGVVRFAVQDSGIGIPADEVPRIFERFYRVDRSRAGGGTGLGLSISRHLIESHGGEIWAESIEGNGSTFYFTLPSD
jgi:two-component system phosphate regulon sensor histidine kinase PhoR